MAAPARMAIAAFSPFNWSRRTKHLPNSDPVGRIGRKVNTKGTKNTKVNDPQGPEIFGKFVKAPPSFLFLLPFVVTF